MLAARSSAASTSSPTPQVTLGPSWPLHDAGQEWGITTITNDGVTVAREVELDDPFENLGAQLTKEVATKTNDVAGDGTTTATVLAQSMVHEGLRYVAAGINPMGLKRGMDKRPPKLSTRRSARPPAMSTTGADMAAVATVSSRDEGHRRAARRGVRQGRQGRRDHRRGVQHHGHRAGVRPEGMQFDKGYLSPYFVTDQESMEAVLDDPYILLHQGKISAIAEMLPAAGEGHPGRQAAVHPRRGRRGRGALHPGGQQDPRHLQRRRGQEPGVR